MELGVVLLRGVQVVVTYFAIVATGVLLGLRPAADPFLETGFTQKLNRIAMEVLRKTETRKTRRTMKGNMRK